MDRRSRLDTLFEHTKSPKHRGVLQDADVVMSGGSSECGGSVVIYLKGDGNGRIEHVSFTGQGDTISMGATSMILERVRREGLTMDEVLALDYEECIDSVGREVVGNRSSHATLGLSTLKSAIRKYRRTVVGA